MSTHTDARPLTWAEHRRKRLEVVDGIGAFTTRLIHHLFYSFGLILWLATPNWMHHTL